MRTTVFSTCMLAAAFWVASAAAQQADDEKAIRLAADAFTKAYNAQDAKALAALFTPEGEIVNEAGEVVQGREGIERVFAGIFEARPKSRIQVTIDSVRFLTPTVAVEDGTSKVVDPDGEEAERNRYTVVHVKQDGAWRMAGARDLPDDEGRAAEALEPLAWLIGEWVAETPGALARTAYRWSENRRFLLGEFTIQVGGRPLMTGSTRIGWDPRAKQLRSWVFDSQGGCAEGRWTRDGNRWIVKMTGFNGDGKSVSSTNVITQTGKDRMTWQSRDRVVGGALLPDIREVPIARKPPQPQPSAR